MPKAITTEPAFNLEFSRVLRRKHPRWKNAISAEQVRVLRGQPQKQPDIVLSPAGSSPVALETEFLPAATVESDAAARLGCILASDNRRIEQAIALRIPKDLRAVPQAELVEAIESAQFTYCILCAGDAGAVGRLPKKGWLCGGIDDVAACADLASLSEALVLKSTDVLELGVAQAANLLESLPGSPGGKLGHRLCQEPGEQTNRMAVAIIANALVFHLCVEGRQGIPRLSELESVQGRLTKLKIRQCWTRILYEVNYWPIFNIATELLECMPSSTANAVLDRLYKTADELLELGAVRLSDLSGRMFQKLIADRKFLATFYTLPVSATLLAELVASRLQVDWRSRESVTNLKIADLACGTGTLVGALYQSVLARCRRAGQDDAEIHSSMIEDALYAFDIMPAATHLAASALSGAHPGVTFGETKVVTMPYGYGEDHPLSLGSLDLIMSESVLSLFSLSREQLVGGRGIKVDTEISVPQKSLDIVIMNPPFTRPCGQEAAKIGIPVPSFAGFGTSEDEQKAMSRRLREISGKLKKSRIRIDPAKGRLAGHGNAGLASNFIDLAHEKLREGGILALVLPFTFVQGDAWHGARLLLKAYYKNIVIVSIAATGSTGRAFSADTGMAEVLVVAERKEAKDGALPTDSVEYANLTRRPDSLLEASLLAKHIHGSVPDEGISRINASISSGGCAGVRALSSLGAAMLGLFETGSIKLPRRKGGVALPVTPLGDLGERGAHVLDITGASPGPGKLPRGPFGKAPLPGNGVPTYPALWNHDAKKETRLLVEPDGRGDVREGCADRAVDFWNRFSSKLHVNVDFQLNSQSLAACLTSKEAIGGRAWPNFLLRETAWEIPVALWANTTIGLMAFWWIGSRQQQGRTILPVSQHERLPVLDPRRLGSDQIRRAGKIFRDFLTKDFLPANEAYRDDVRKALDRAVLVDLMGISEEMLEPLDVLRDQWCAEPSVHGGKSTAPPQQAIPA